MHPNRYLGNDGEVAALRDEVRFLMQRLDSTVTSRNDLEQRVEQERQHHEEAMEMLRAELNACKQGRHSHGEGVGSVDGRLTRYVDVSSVDMEEVMASRLESGSNIDDDDDLRDVLGVKPDGSYSVDVQYVISYLRSQMDIAKKNAKASTAQSHKVWIRSGSLFIFSPASYLFFPLPLL